MVFAPGEGKRFEARGSVMMFKATAGSTGGAMSLMERELPPKASRNTPAHVHVGMIEAFYILEGRVDFKVDSEEISCGPGNFYWFPEAWGTRIGTALMNPRACSSSTPQRWTDTSRRS